MNTNGKQQSGKSQNNQLRNKAQVIEQLRDLGSSSIGSLTRDVVMDGSREFLGQMFGLPEKRVTGNLIPGETLEMREAMTGKLEQKKQVQAQLVREKQLRQEEKILASRKEQQLRMELSALTSEVSQLGHATQGLSREVQTATMQAPVEPGTYHVVFFEKLLGFIRSFRKKIENASVWLSSYNTRAKKRTNSFWGQVKVGGGKRLLSSEDYSGRAAA